MAKTSNPRRRIKVTINLQADSWKEAAHTLDEIQFSFLEAHEKNLPFITSVSGGSRSGWTIDGNQDETITHESYFETIKKVKADNELS